MKFFVFCIASMGHTRITFDQLLATDYIDIMLNYLKIYFHLNQEAFISIIVTHTRILHIIYLVNSMYRSRFVFMSDVKISCLYIVRLVVFHYGCHEEKGKFPANPNIDTYICLECKRHPLWLEHNDRAFYNKIYLQAQHPQCNLSSSSHLYTVQHRLVLKVGMPVD
jgi:hypothetical protein